MTTQEPVNDQPYENRTPVSLITVLERPQPVVVGGPIPTADEFVRRLREFGRVFIAFTQTRGGTDLAVRIDAESTKPTGDDLSAVVRNLHVEGTLTLDFEPVRVIADLDLTTLTGVGRVLRTHAER